jgi:hypothetical protein
MTSGSRLASSSSPYLDELLVNRFVFSIGLDGHVMAGEVEPELLRQAQRFVALNRQVLSEYWHYRIDTDELRQRLQSIDSVIDPLEK